MKEMTANLLDLLFGCAHRNLSFPFTVKRGRPRTTAAIRTGTYRVCLDCGREFAYDWQEMRIVPQIQPAAHAHHALEVKS